MQEMIGFIKDDMQGYKVSDWGRKNVAKKILLSNLI